MAENFSNADDILNVLVATDIHLGYGEKDPIKGEDSFNTFEEILQTAVEKQVDMILLGGDLFHETKPSASCMNKCISLIRKYCMGGKAVEFDCISDQEINFQHCANKFVNYEDPNLNISLPIFSIHGNHDDPTGVSQLSALDILSSMGLINYFGKITNYEDVEVYPLLLKKGNTIASIYGLSHIKDVRLCRLFIDGKVTLLQPQINDEIFSLMVLHQNRVDRGIKNYIPEYALPDFLNLVVWGHEHQCRIDVEESVPLKIPITQPGSTVATSLSQDEAENKHIALLRLCKNTFQLDKIRLQTVRPFEFDTVSTEDCDYEYDIEKPISNQVEDYVKRHIELMIERVSSKLTGHPKQPVLPLIRLRVEYSKEDEFINTLRLGYEFNERIANIEDCIIMKRTLKNRNISLKDEASFELDPKIIASQLRDRVETKVEEYFETAPDRKKLQVLTVTAMSQALMAFVDKNDVGALDYVLQNQETKMIEKLKELNPDEKTFEEAIIEVRKARDLAAKEEAEETKTLLDNPDRPKIARMDEDLVDLGDSDDETKSVSAPVTKGKANSRQPKKAAAPTPPPTQKAPKATPPSRVTPARTTTTRSGRTATQAISSSYITLDDSSDEEISLSARAKRGKTAVSKTPAKPATTNSRRSTARGKTYTLESDEDF